MDILKFTEEHDDFRKRLKEFLKEAVVPYVDEWEADHITPKSVWQKMGKQGFLSTGVAPEYGGIGGDFLYSVIIADELARTNQTGLAASLHSDIVVPYITSFGSEEQKKRYLPGCVSGDIITAVAMTESDAGSDVASMTTTAVADGDEIVINGSKTFISNGVNCGLVVLAAMDPTEKNKHQAVSLYLVEEGTPGFKKGRPFEKMGWKSQDTAELFFTDCRIPKENRLGEPGMGFLMLMQKLQQERLVCAMGGIFAAEHMLDWTVDYCKNHNEGGKPLSKFQGTQFALVEMITEVKMLRVFMEKLVVEHMEGKDIISETCMAKFRFTEFATQVANDCLDLIGNDGTLESCPLVRNFRDTRITSIFAGTNQIMRSIVGKMLQL